MRLAPVLLLLSSTALGQTFTIKLGLQAQTEVSISPSQCGDTITGTAQVGATSGTSCSDMTVYIATGSCGSEPTAEVIATFTALEMLTQQTISIPVGSLPFSSAADAGGACGATGFEQTFLVCAAAKFQSGLNNCAFSVSSTPGKIIYDAKPPAVPGLTSVVALDGALAIRASSNDSDAVSLIVEAKVATAPDTDYSERATLVLPTTNGTVSGLSNGTEYSVRVRSRDAANNTSGPSAALNGTPIHSEGFFEHYRNLGGEEEGGCAAAGGTPWLGALLVSALAMFLVRRQR